MADLHLGSVLSGGGSVPADNSPAGWADMVDALQEQALSTRLGIPLLYGVDSVHGHGNLNGATVFPHNIGLGATRNVRLVEKIGHITAEETRATGPQWTFAPCVCVARDDRWGRTYESFGENPRLAARMAAIIEGLQGRPDGRDLDEPDRVLATAKHYAGDGLTTFGSAEGDYTIDQGITEVSHERFWRNAVAPYVPAVRRYDVGSVMPSFSSVDWTEDGLGNPLKMHAHDELINGVLKNDLGFEGFVISDWRAIHQIPGDYATQVATSVNAGVDMFMEPFSGDPSGTPSSSRPSPTWWTTAWSRSAGSTMPCRASSRRSSSSACSSTRSRTAPTFRTSVAQRTGGSPARRLRSRRSCCATSTARCLSPRTAGSTWPAATPTTSATRPGAGRSPGRVARPTSSRARRSSTASRTRLTVPSPSPKTPPRRYPAVPTGSWSSVRRRTPRASATSAVRSGPTTPATTACRVRPRRWSCRPPTRHAIETLCAHERESCSVVVVSGRPMIIPPDLLAQIDSLVASWLPGSEGAGVADVLFGRRDFTGKLPVTWPRTVAQEPINVGDASYDPLYAYGWGLSTRR